MLIKFVLTLLISFEAMAGHLDTVCENAHYRRPLFSDNYVAYDGGSEYVMTDFNGSKIFSTKNTILSITKTQSSLWVLTPEWLIELGFDGIQKSAIELYENKTMTASEDYLLIVRKGGYLTNIDVKTKRELWTTNLSEVSGGQALGVAFDGQNAQVIMTSTHQNGFNGIATVDMSNGKVIRKTGYDYVRAGVIDPEANGKWYNGNLVLNNGGWIHIITSAQLAKGKTMRPKWVAKTEGTGAELRYMMLKGEFTTQGNELMGCGFTHDVMKLFTVKIF